MAITTYAELQTAAANWLVRSDLTSRIPEFITLAEARINRLLRHRLGETETTLTGTVGQRTIALPSAAGSAYDEAMALWILIDGDRREPGLVYRDATQLPVTDESGQPEYWTIDGANLAFERPLDSAYSFPFRFMKKYVLSDSLTTNSLLTEAPDIYLFGALCEAAPFLRDAELAGAYEAKFERAVRELNSNDHRARSKQALRTDVVQLVPDRRGFDIRRGE